ncbi:hypothetical protein A8V49_06525 [Yersinia pestis]|nr:hypothetical protein A8V49_06525 [Yersinia pestis]
MKQHRIEQNLITNNIILKLFQTLDKPFLIAKNYQKNQANRQYLFKSIKKQPCRPIIKQW